MNKILDINVEHLSKAADAAAVLVDSLAHCANSVEQGSVLDELVVYLGSVALMTRSGVESLVNDYNRACDAADGSEKNKSGLTLIQGGKI